MKENYKIFLKLLYEMDDYIVKEEDQKIIDNINYKIEEQKEKLNELINNSIDQLDKIYYQLDKLKTEENI